MRGALLLAYALTAAAFLTIAGCSRETVNAASNAAPATTIESVADRNLVTVASAERFSVAPVVVRREFDRTLSNGVVAADVSRTYPITALSSGRVVEIKARLGDDVRKGQHLLTISSSDMSQALSDLQKFRANETLTKSQSDRAQVLNSHGVLAQKELEIAQDAYAKAKIDTQTAEERIRLLGGDPRQLSPRIEIHSPVAGTIIEQNVTSSTAVKSLDNSPSLFTVADLSNVWVLCDVFENDLARVHPGDRAEIELNAYPNRKLTGRVANISKLLDPNTRAAKVRVELANDSGILRPNMFASVSFLSQGSEVRLVIPASAVLRLQDRDWVFVKLNGQQFRRTEIQAGPVDSDKTQIVLHGLRAGEQVVADALTFDREVQKSSEQ